MDVQLPINRDAEAIILGRMMSSIDAANDAIESLQDADFYFPEHQAIFKAMTLLQQKEAAIEPVAVYQAWHETSKKADMALIYGLSQHTSGYTDDLTYFIEIVHNCSVYRRLISHAQELMTLASSQKMSPDELQAKILESTEMIFHNQHEESLHHVGESYTKKDYMDSGLKYMQYVQKKRDDYNAGRCTLSGYPTGYDKLDGLLDGINKGHLIIVGARPGVGKTTFILNLIERMCVHKGIRVGFFSLEATLDQAMNGFICLSARVESGKVRKGTLTDAEVQRLLKVQSQIADKPFYLDEKESLKMSQVFARVKRMIRNHGIEVLFVDYLGELKGDGKYTNKQEEMQIVSRGLRAIAKKMNIPVICVAQLNRESEKGNRVPIKSDLRESGQIEADAHSILMLHRPDQEDQYNKPGILNLYIVKNRFGREGKISFDFDKDTGVLTEQEVFVNPSREQEYPEEDPLAHLR